MTIYIVEENEQPEEFLMQLSQQAELVRGMINTTNYDYAQIKAKMDTYNIFTSPTACLRDEAAIKYILELYPGLSITNFLIREINLRCDPFDADIVKSLSSVCANLMKYVDHPRKEDIIDGNLFLLAFIFYIGVLDHETL